MRIINNFSVQETRKRQATSKAGNTSAFSGHLDAEAVSGQSAAIESAMPLSTLGSLLAIQDDGFVEGRPKSEFERGERTLDQLEDLRLQMLDGRPDRKLLEDIERMAQDRIEDDVSPGLRDVLDEIELRAAVELAKLDQEV